MELLSNAKIIHHLDQQVIFDLSVNNDIYGIIVPFDDDPCQELKNIFTTAIYQNQIKCGYYRLRNLFNMAQSQKPDVVITLIIELVNNYLSLITSSIDDELDLPLYMQIWAMYKKLFGVIIELVKNQKHLLQLSIKNGKTSMHIVHIVKMTMFYTYLIKPNENMITSISSKLSDIDNHNVEQFIDYVDSIRCFMMVHEFTDVNKQELCTTLQNMIKSVSITNTLCTYVHRLLKNVDYELVLSNFDDKQYIQRISKIISILNTYGDKSKVMICYQKFMQARIIDTNYKNLKIEAYFVRLFTSIEKDNVQKLLNAISDMTNITPVNNIIKPIILTRKNWNIYNTSNLELNYPSELRQYIEVATEHYSKLYKNEYVIKWQATLGSACFVAKLKSKTIRITCNMLQAIALSYLNDNPKTFIAKFAESTLIEHELATKIFESLFESNLIIYKGDTYRINYNYVAGAVIDIRQAFTEAFETEVSQENIS